MQSLVTFGAPHLTLPTRTLGPGKAVALLAYLSATPSRSTPRKDAFRLLYDDDTPRDSDAFRQLLASLRKLLPGTFVTTGDTVQLTEPLASDRQAFLDAVARGDHDAAVALYTAEFFDPFDEPGCDGFRRWAQEERLRLRRRFEVAAECVVRRHLASAHWTAALATASDIAERFPALHVSARLLTETLILSGRGGDVRTILTELGATRIATAPTSQPRALDLLLDTLTALAREHRLGDLRRPLIGRETECRALLDAWNAARTGAGATVLLAGEEGAGKSRLLDNLALRLRLDTPSLVGPVRTQPTAATTPVTTDQVVQQIAAGILPLPGALGTTPQHYLVLKRLAEGLAPDADATADRQFRLVVDALTDGLRAASEEAPVAIVLDEPGPADSATVRILAELSVRLRTSRVLLVVASRHTLSGAVETSTRERITLAGLSEQETQRLVSCATDVQTATTDAAAMYTATRGLPGSLLALLDGTEHPNTAAERGAAHRRAPAPVRVDEAPRRSRAPSWYHRPLTRVASAAVFGGITIIATVGAIRSARAEAAPESFTLLTWQGDSVSRESFVIGDDDITATTARFNDESRVSWWPLSRTPDRVRIAPDGETIAVQIETDGLNTMDIRAVRGDSTFPLVTGLRDDGTPEWSPDGGLLAFSTNRWSDSGNEGCDIAITDVGTKDVWRVTSGPDCDSDPRWTSDGLGLAFLRKYRASGDQAAICTVRDFDEQTACTAIDPTLHAVELIGWRTASTILFAASTDSSSAIYTLDVTSGTSTPLLTGLVVIAADLSPSRTYLACWCGTTAEIPARITLYDLNSGRPLYSRGVSPSAPFRHIAWHARQELLPARITDRVAVMRRLDRETMASAPVSRSADTLARARAMIRENFAEVAKAARERVLPRAPDESAPSDNVGMQPLLDERWTTIDTTRWVPFGLPRPRAGSQIGGLDPGGDGSYPSGLYLRAPFQASNGFVVEARISVPITLAYWQGIAIMTESEAYARAVGTWSHREGTWPRPPAEGMYESGIQYPAIEGGTRAMTVAVLSARRTLLAPISPVAGDGHDVVMRMEYGADSMMTVYANGLRMARRRYVPTKDGRYRLFVFGHSVETAVRVRRLRVWGMGAH